MLIKLFIKLKSKLIIKQSKLKLIDSADETALPVRGMVEVQRSSSRGSDHLRSMNG